MWVFNKFCAKKIPLNHLQNRASIWKMLYQIYVEKSPISYKISYRFCFHL